MVRRAARAPARGLAAGPVIGANFDAAARPAGAAAAPRHAALALASLLLELPSTLLGRGGGVCLRLQLRGPLGRQRPTRRALQALRASIHCARLEDAQLAHGRQQLHPKAARRRRAARRLLLEGVVGHARGCEQRVQRLHPRRRRRVRVARRPAATRVGTKAHAPGASALTSVSSVLLYTTRRRGLMRQRSRPFALNGDVNAQGHLPPVSTRATAMDAATQSRQQLLTQWFNDDAVPKRPRQRPVVPPPRIVVCLGGDGLAPLVVRRCGSPAPPLSTAQELVYLQATLRHLKSRTPSASFF